MVSYAKLFIVYLTDGHDSQINSGFLILLCGNLPFILQHDTRINGGVPLLSPPYRVCSNYAREAYIGSEGLLVRLKFLIDSGF